MSTTRPAGIFIWYELMTADSAAAIEFYSHVVGWTAAAMPSSGVPYTLLSSGGVNAGGVLQLSPEMCAAGVPECWIGYIGVADVDAMVEKLKAAGGVVHRAPEDIPTVGRFAVVADPHGAAFQIMTPISKEPLPEIAPDAPGHVGWRELHAGNAGEAWTFYSELFGWTKDMAVDMGPMGVYQTFATGGAPVGGMMTKPAHFPSAFWAYYFTVPTLDAAIERVKARGGQLLNGPHEVPGGSFIANCMDPRGAMFSLVSRSR